MRERQKGERRPLYEGGGGAHGPGHATRAHSRGRPAAVGWPLGNAVEGDVVARDRAGRRRPRR
jgi:hypothetical protein